MSNNDASSAEVLDGTPEGDEPKELLKTELQGAFVIDEPFDEDTIYISAGTDSIRGVLEFNLDRRSDQGTLEASDGRKLHGEWYGSFANLKCDSCGTQVGKFNFRIDSPWETESPLAVDFNIENSSETLEIAEVDPANRDLFLKYFGWMFEE